MARVELRQDLNAMMARRVRSTVQELTRRLAAEAARRAPAAKVWITAADERVRPAHRKADGQTIPENIRFKLARQVYIRKGRRRDRRAVNVAGGMKIVPGEWVLAREPRDDDLPEDQKTRCRCIAVVWPGAIGKAVRAEPVTVTATGARGRVSVRFERIEESEFGTSGDRAARFLGGAVDIVAAELRSARARRT
ncbi:hypothetical protein ACFY05_32180 [Microtetraspora fusca]|uniref:Phage head morphogenesis domain-containing protein n=1 Tax=Microtetraspora fusca TaxID=1997 RepID=A0ABW6VEH8_MICFU